MDFLTNVLAIAGKDLRILFKDKGSLAVLFLLPLLFIGIIGGPSAALSQASEAGPEQESVLRIDAYMVNLDEGDYGDQIVEGLRRASILRLKALYAVEEADALVAEGDRAAAVVIPADFSRRIDDYEQTQIQVIVDPQQQEASDIVAGIVGQAAGEIEVLGEIRHGIRAVIYESGINDQIPPEALQALEMQTLGVIWTQVEEFKRNPLIRVESRSLGEEEPGRVWNPAAFNTAGFTVMFAFFLVGIVAESLWKEKESGAFRRLLSSPMHKGALIGGKIVAYMLVVFLQVLVMFGVGNTFFNVSLGDSFAGLLVLTLALAFVSASMGLMIGALASSSKQAANMGMILGFVLMVIGGCIYPTFWREGVIFYLSQITPHAHAVEAYLELMAMGGTLMTVLPNILILLVMGVVFFGVAVWRMEFD